MEGSSGAAAAAQSSEEEEFTVRLTSRLEAHGVVAVPGAVDGSLCRLVAEAAHNEILRSPSAEFGNIQASEHRKDYPLRLEVPYTDAFGAALRVIAPALTRLLGEDAVLVEFAALNSYPGAGEQNPHPDAGKSL